MNYFDPFDWETMLSRCPNSKEPYSVQKYHQILCPASDYPEFLNKYLQLPLLTRLKGIGLLCGTDWTSLYHNRFYYSRFDHSVGVALIVWHFTHDKAQTLAGLFHDVSTSVFSHVSDFRKGDALTQTATEAPNAAMIRGDIRLAELLKADGLTADQVCDYHIYPVADNEIPQLSADRLEYMYPSGIALDGSWTYEEIRRTYSDIKILQNEDGLPELGFMHKEIAEEYCRHFCMIGHILQLNENKLTLHLLGQIMNKATELKALDEADFMTLSEEQVLLKLERFFEQNCLPENVKNDDASCSENTTPSASEIKKLWQLYKTFRTMTKIAHTDGPLPDHFCVNLEVKQRYINPLVAVDEKAADRTEGKICSAINVSGSIDHSSRNAVNVSGNMDYSSRSADQLPRGRRLSEASPAADKIITDFLSWHDTAFGCVPLVQKS